jgi:hypothetical protein
MHPRQLPDRFRFNPKRPIASTLTLRERSWFRPHF